MESQYHPDQTLQADLRQYIALLWQWAWLIVLATLLAGGAAYITSQFQDPVYQATTTLLINEAPSTKVSDYTAILTSERLARTYSEMLTKRPVLEEVIQDLDLALAYEDIEEMQGVIEVQLVRDTQLIEVSVEDTDPQQAALIANTLVAVFAEQNQALQASRYAESKASLEEQLTRLNGQIHNAVAALEALKDESGTEGEGTQLEAEIAQYRQTYSELLQSYEQIRVAEAQATSNVVQVEPAIPPEKPVRPRVLMNTALAAVVGGMLAVGAIFLVEALDDTLKNPDDVSRHLGLPILGTILKHEVENGNPVTAEEPRSPTSEAYRALRTNIQYASVDYPIRSLLVTSPSANEGKSTIAANLGVVLAQGGKRSILVDADMRRPTLHKKLKVPNRVGLSAFFVFHSLSGDTNEHPEGAIQGTLADGLSVIPSGKIPPNPSELLASERMSKVIERLKQDAEIIIVDSPPVTAVTDSSVLAPRMDGVLLVIQPGVTKLDAARHAVEQLHRVGANLIGVVLNNVEPKSSRYGYYYRYDRAYYAEEESARERSLRARRSLRWAVVGILSALVIGLGGWYALTSDGGLPVWLGGSETPTPTRMPIAGLTTAAPSPEANQNTPTPTLQSGEAAVVVTADAEVTQIPTQTPTITPTLPPPTPGPGLETPFGGQGEYLLHQVKFGDNLPKLARAYKTERDVIAAANALIPDHSLQPDQVIVILPGRTDSFGIEPLVVLFLDKDTMVSELASRYGVTIDELRQYNDLGPGEKIPAGRWLIMPERDVTPTPTATAVPSVDLSLALTSPFGPNDDYVLHQIISGQSIPVLENLYLTSADVLNAANEIEGSLQLGRVLVIMPEHKDPSGIVPFTVLNVDEDISVENLAEELGILTADLLFHNDLESGQVIPAGRWIIYPTPPEE